MNSYLPLETIKELQDIILLNKKEDIVVRDIYKEVKASKTFSKSEATFRNLFRLEFKFDHKDGKWKYIGIHDYRMDLDNNETPKPVSIGSDKDDPNLNSTEAPVGNNNDDEITEGKKAVMKNLSNNNNISSSSTDIKKESISSSPKDPEDNIKAILFKLNQLEHKVTRMDKFINQIIEDKNKMHSLSKSIINFVAEVLNEKK